MKKVVAKKNDPLLKNKDAYRVLKYIIKHWIRDKRPGTYNELEKHVIKSGGDGLLARFPLGWIEEWCALHGLPPLNVICVNKTTHRPGSWCYKSEPLWRAQVDTVQSFDWANTIVFE